MSLTEKHASPFSTLFSLKPKKQTAACISKPFEETLIARLNSLFPIPDSSPWISLPWLSHASDLLTLTLADAVAILSDPSLSPADRDALSSHLDSSVAFLDACNAITAAVDRIRHGRLFVCLALYLISSSSSSLSPDRRRRARSAIADWEDGPSALPSLSPLQSKNPTRKKLTAVGRAIYAIEAFFDLIARSVLGVLGGRGDFLSGVVPVSGEFPWATAYNEVVAKLGSGEIAASELEAAKISVRNLAVAIEEEGDGVNELRDAVKGAEKAMEELDDGLDRLSSAVNGVFRAALEAREAALQCFRVGPGMCKVSRRI